MEPSTSKSSDLENDSPSKELLQNVAELSDLKTSPSNENEPLDHGRATGSNSEKIEIPETTVTSSKESKSEINIEDGRVKNTEKYNKIRSSIRKLSRTIRRPPVVLTFESQEKQKQHVYGNIQGNPQHRRNENLPPLPSYYPRPPRNQQEGYSGSNQDLISYRFPTAPPFFSDNWCPYPSSIPSNTPACLAQLVHVDALFVIQGYQMFEVPTDFSNPNIYFIQNKNGQYLYYTSEMYSCMPKCCCGYEGTHFILKDIYQNEVIFMDKSFGCNSLCCFCCYPMMEVYAPPSVPVGAIYKVCESFREDYIILDADENTIFKIRGSIGRKSFLRNDINFTIYAMDDKRTIVGYIWQPGDFRTYSLSSQIIGITFPSNLDARIKSVFLGALMLVKITYGT